MATKKLRTVGAVLGTTAANVYTAPTSTDVVIVHLCVANVGTVTATYQFSIAGHVCAKGTTIGIGTTDVHIDGGPMFLQPGETISAVASNAATVELTASLVERDSL